MTTSTPAPPVTYNVTAIERRTRPGMMPSLFLAPGVQDGTPSVAGIFAEVDAVNGNVTVTFQLSQMPDEDDWGVDATFRGSFPVHANGFGARYLIVNKASAELAAILDAAAVKAGL